MKKGHRREFLQRDRKKRDQLGEVEVFRGEDQVPLLTLLPPGNDLGSEDERGSAHSPFPVVPWKFDSCPAMRTVFFEPVEKGLVADRCIGFEGKYSQGVHRQSPHLNLLPHSTPIHYKQVLSVSGFLSRLHDFHRASALFS